MKDPSTYNKDKEVAKPSEKKQYRDTSNAKLKDPSTYNKDKEVAKPAPESESE